MSRPTGWDVLGEPSDPVPGDPEAVAELGRKLRSTADSITRQADEIKALASVESWKGKAADKYRNQAEDASGKLRKAFHRYDAAANALGTAVGDSCGGGNYASELHRAQKLADRALRDAEEAHSEETAATHTLGQQPKDAPPDDPICLQLKSRQENASNRMQHAREDVRTAKDIRDRAAKAAANAIKHAIKHDGLKDSPWDKFKNLVHENADWIKKIGDIAGWIATVCGILSLLVGWIPVIGQALAGILGTIALIATAVALAAHLLLALAGEGSWLDVGLDIVALATFGLGRAAIGGARGAAAGAKAAARGAKYRQAMQGATGQAAKKGTKAYNKAVQKARKAANREAGGAPRGKAAAEAMANAPKGRFPGWNQIRSGFSLKSIGQEIWQSVKDLSAFRNAGDLFKGATWNGARFSVTAGLMDEASNLGKVSPALLGDDAVKPFVDVYRQQTNLWIASTGAATAVDLSDKGKLFDLVGAKDPLTREIG